MHILTYVGTIDTPDYPLQFPTSYHFPPSHAGTCQRYAALCAMPTNSWTAVIHNNSRVYLPGVPACGDQTLSAFSAGQHGSDSTLAPMEDTIESSKAKSTATGVSKDLKQ